MVKILVVDDEAELRTAISISLSLEGFETMEAENGLVAFDIVKNQKPDIIISDVAMGPLSGFLFREQIKNLDTMKRILWIFISGHAADCGAWKSDPSVVYLEKPFSIPSLFNAIKRVQLMSESQREVREEFIKVSDK